MDSAMDEYDPWMDEEELSVAASTSVSSSGGGAVGGGSTTPSTQISTQEWDKLSSRYSDAGYRDGITAGKNSKLQQGFDEGFALAAPYARELGSLRGTAASLLALLTTASGAKHAGSLLDVVEGGVAGGVSKESLVTELRDLVNLLGKLDANRILPIDLEAEEHAKSHQDEGISQLMKDKKDMRDMEDRLSRIGGGGQAPLSLASPSRGGVAECRERLGRVLTVFGMEEILPPPHHRS